MNWPTSQDYNEAIQNSTTSMSDPDLKTGEATVNAMGLPVPRSGNFADVYQFKGGDGRMWAVKCFTRHVEGLQERYAKIDEYLSKANLRFTVGFKYLAEGLRIQGKWFPLLKMEWVEGFTLNEFVRQNADKPKYLHALMQMWAKLTGKLRTARIAHADLQHGNVLLVPGNATSKLGLRLIDYDGMWVPPLADNHSGEVGHPNFQHPFRLKDRSFNADVDRFPHLVIAAALRATLVGGKTIWDKYDNGDNLLFREQDLRNPGNSKIFKALWQLDDPVLCTLIGHIALSSDQPLRKTPWLDDILLEKNGPRLRPDEEKQAEKLLGVGAPSRSIEYAAASTSREEFSDFENLDEDDDDEENAGKKSGTRKILPDKRQKKAKDKGWKRPLQIAGAVVVLGLLGGVFAMMAGGKNTSTQVAQNDSDEEKPKQAEPLKFKSIAKDTGAGKIKLKDPSKEVKTNSSARPAGVVDNKTPIAKATVPQIDIHGVEYTRIAQTERFPDAVVEFPVQFTSDGNYFGVARRKSITVVETATGKTVKTLDIGSEPVSFCFGAASIIYVVTKERFQAWDWKQNERIRDGSSRVMDNAQILQVQQMKKPGRLLLAAGRRKLNVWDADNWQSVEEMPLPGSAAVNGVVPQNDRVSKVAFSEDGSRGLVHCSKGCWVWDTENTAAKRLLLENYASEVLKNCVLSANGKWVVGVPQPKDPKSPATLLIWDALDGKLLTSRADLNPDIHIAGFLSNGNCVLSSEGAPRLLVLNVPTGKTIDDRRVHSLNAATFPSENILVCLDENNNCGISNVNSGAKPASKEVVKGRDPKTQPKKQDDLSGALVKTSASFSDRISSVVFSNDGQKIYATTDSRMLHIVDAATLEETAKYAIPGGKVREMLISPKAGASRLYLLDDNKRIRQIDADKGTQLKQEINLDKLVPNLGEYTTQMCLSPEGDILIVTNLQRLRPVFWDTNKWSEAESFPPKLQRLNAPGNLLGVAFSHDSRIGAQYRIGKLNIWNYRNDGDIRTIDTNSVRRIELIFEAQVVLVEDNNRKFRAWNYNGKALWADKPHGADNNFVYATIPKFSGFVSAGDDDTIRVWEAPSFAETAQWTFESSQSPTAIAVSPDGKFAVTAHLQKNQLRLWALPVGVGKKK